MQRHADGEPLECFRQYAEAFQALDPTAVARHFYEPALLITPHGVASLNTRAEVEQAYGRLMADLPAQGYARTDFSSLDERQLSEDLAIVSGTGVWRKTTGEAFAPFGLMYTLRRAERAWRIVIAMIYQRNATPPLAPTD
jgi:ketosteroid isomerase-like protein